MELTTKIIKDDIVEQISNIFDYNPDDMVTSQIPDFELPLDFNIGLIVGGSGSGKTTILNNINRPKEIIWDEDRSIVSHFNSFEDARDKLGASGLNSIPSWVRPYHTLSNGEQFRVDLARKLEDNATIDEFTSVVDRNVAKSCCVSMKKYVDRVGLKGIVLASCHKDIIEWLQADWVFDADVGEFQHRGLLRQRPEINIKLHQSTTKIWPLFSKHHYLDGKINKSARCWLAEWDGVIVGFTAVLAHPSGTVKNAWRGHRSVVLPEFQGLGIGAAMSDAVGEIFVSQGCRYFSKTAHPNFGEYRENSKLWKPTSKNKKSRKDYSLDRKNEKYKHKMLHRLRICYSHEYIGEK